MSGGEDRGYVLLVGSAPFTSAEEMFRISMAHLGPHLKRLPDGEVGERDHWIRWQYRRIGQSPQMRLRESDRGDALQPPYGVPRYEIMEGVASAGEIVLPNLGYGDAAIESFAIFRRLSEEGVVPGDVRFQVGLPTPLSVTAFYVEPGSQMLFEEAYGCALGREVDKILEVVPASRLSIQWEVVCEFAMLEGLREHRLGDDLLDGLNQRIAGLVDLVPGEVEAGIHLCYGDSGHKHFCEPADAGHLVDVANGVSARARRPIEWIHIPVPRERDDHAYFAPLSRLELQPGCQLYLGLVHMTGGIEGTRRRIAAAEKIVEGFGIATECGLGRRAADTIPDLFRQHADLAGSPTGN